MSITDQQRKLFWIVAAILVAAYFAPTVIGLVLQVSDRIGTPSAPAYHKPSPSPASPYASTPPPVLAPAAPTPSGQPDTTPSTTPVAPFDKLTGIWTGNGTVAGGGFCAMRFELRDNDDAPGTFAGFTSLNCLPIAPKEGRINVPLMMLSKISPASAILTGNVTDGTLRLHVTKAIGKDANGCAMTALTATPFGANQLAVEWQSGACPSGQAMLQKARP
jgi:hypothetical protein